MKMIQYNIEKLMELDKLIEEDNKLWYMMLKFIEDEKNA